MSSSIAGTAEARPELIASTIPILDVAPYLAGEPGARKRLGAELRWAFEKVGFYYLRGHGIPQSLIDATFAQAARFHALPLERKLAVKVRWCSSHCRARPVLHRERPARVVPTSGALTPPWSCCSC